MAGDAAGITMSETQEMYIAYIKDAIKSKSLGNASRYNDLCQHLESLAGHEGASSRSEEGVLTANSILQDVDSAMSSLTGWLSAFSHLITSFDKTHLKLVETILLIPWTRMPASTQGELFVKSYIDFLGRLASARLEFVSVIVKQLVIGLTYDAGKRLPRRDEYTPSRKIIYDRVHDALQNVLSITPTAISTLQRSLSTSYPHESQSQSHHTTFALNCLRMLDYAPDLRQTILTVLVGGAISVDVQIQLDLEDLEEAVSNDDMTKDPRLKATQEDVFGMEFEEESDDDTSLDVEPTTTMAGPLDSDEEADDDFADGLNIASVSPTQVIKEMIRKLDAILNILFDHITTKKQHQQVGSELLAASSSKSSGHLQLFKILLTIFESTVMPTFRSRYTQFLIFWSASKDTEACDLFLGILVGRSLDEGIAGVTRVSATAYTASFVSRSKAVNALLSQTVVRYFCTAVQGYLDRAEASGSQLKPDASRHVVFYALTQAIFYIFCFRWRDLHGIDDNGHSVNPSIDTDPVLEGPGTSSVRRWMPCLSVLDRAVHSSLNPLSICSPDIVGQFEQVAHMTNFLFVGGIIEANRRSHFSQTSAQSGNAKSALPRSQSYQGRSDSGINRNKSGIEALASASSSSNPSTPISIQNLVQPRTRPSTGRTSTPTVTTRQGDLHSFFPFDPYNLRLSRHYMDDIYRNWSEVAIESNVTESEESELTESELADDFAQSLDDRRGRNRYLSSVESRPYKENGFTLPKFEKSPMVGPEFGMSIGGRSERSEYLSSDLSQSLDAMSVSPVRASWLLGESSSSDVAGGYELSPILTRYD